MSFKEAETTLLVADVRSGIQVASAEGKASKMNFSLGGWGWGGFGWASAGGYSSKYKVGFIASGIVSGRGEMQMTGAGQAGSATFTGKIDPASGAVMGQWQWVSGPGKGAPGGSFQGQRQ